MPHASVIRTRSGITLALVAVIAGGALSALLIAGWIYAMVVLETIGSPGFVTILAVGAVCLGAFRLAAERRVTALAIEFPQSYILHAVMTGKQRRQLLAFAKDAGIEARIPALGGRLALVATPDWVRVYRGMGSPTAVIEIPRSRVAGASFVTTKSFLATQSLLRLQLTGATAAWTADLAAVFFRSITATAIPEQFYAEELAALNAGALPATR